MTKALIHVNPQGKWLDCPVDLSGAKLVASSRSGATEVYRSPDGRYYELFYLKSGNIDLDEVSGIPEYLTRRY